MRDAEDAIRGRDGYDLDGAKIRVEFPRSFRDREESRGGYRSSGGFSRSNRDGGFRFNRNRYDNTMRRSQNRVIITGLPPSGSWQDLKDHMRKAGDVCYADVSKDGTGVVEFVQAEDMRYAVKKLDDTKFRSHEGETAYIRVRVDDRNGGGSGGGGARRSRSGSPRRRSRSPIDRRTPDANGRDRETKRERSPSHSRSRSAHSRSRSVHSRSRSPM
ncbi:probable splicing factor, arginine/serine-rich 3 isoform X2 [Paramacrobiotus metropolitanus]|uniref:probable splicing factor, arginine/serine-rich 3 isoform X2 n=1 Tax=Paramacrobiotus metropolitanus TaxID=2943436 RepID=UPI0024459D93|nr:probable splicing factor, arginine/serine-rich 3 isoform X2 [Paramacrobiotus metropolitanus]